MVYNLNDDGHVSINLFPKSILVWAFIKQSHIKAILALMKMACSFEVQPLSQMYTAVHLAVSCNEVLCKEVYVANLFSGIPKVWKFVMILDQYHLDSSTVMWWFQSRCEKLFLKYAFEQAKTISMWCVIQGCSQDFLKGVSKNSIKLSEQRSLLNRWLH